MKKFAYIYILVIALFSQSIDAAHPRGRVEIVGEHLGGDPLHVDGEIDVRAGERLVEETPGEDGGLLHEARGEHEVPGLIRGAIDHVRVDGHEPVVSTPGLLDRQIHTADEHASVSSDFHAPASIVTTGRVNVSADSHSNPVTTSESGLLPEVHLPARVPTQHVTVPAPLPLADSLATPLHSEEHFATDASLPSDLRLMGATAQRMTSAEQYSRSLQEDPLYAQGIELLGEIMEKGARYSVADEDRISSSILEEFVDILNTIQTLDQPVRTQQFKNMIGKLKSLKQAQSLAITRQKNLLVREGNVYSLQVGQEVNKLIIEQQALWTAIIQRSHNKEVVPESLLAYQKDIIEILHSKESPAMVLAKLRSLDANLEIVKASVGGAQEIKASEATISDALLDDVESTFNKVVRFKAEELNDLLDGGPDTFEVNYLRLYARKEIQVLEANPQATSVEALEFLDKLIEQIQSQKIGELSELYAIRLSAMDFTIRMNYMRIIEQALAYAQHHEFTPNQKHALLSIRQDVLAQNSIHLERDLTGFEATLDSHDGVVMHGTVTQQALLRSRLDLMKNVFDGTPEEQRHLTTLFDQLYMQLHARGAAGDPVVAALVAVPDALGQTIGSRVLEKLDLILDYYSFEVAVGNMSSRATEGLRATISELKVALEPKVSATHERLALPSGSSVQVPLGLRELSTALERQLGIESLATQAHTKREFLQAYLEEQSEASTLAIDLRLHASSLLKRTHIPEAELEAFITDLTSYKEKITNLASQTPESLNHIVDLITLNESIITKLTQKLSLLEPASDDYKDVSAQIEAIHEEQKLLQTYEKNMQHISFSNELVLEFYQQILRGLKGESMDLLHSTTRFLSGQIIPAAAAGIMVSELAALGSTIDEGEVEDSLECTKKTVAIYRIEVSLDEILGALNRLKTLFFQAKEEKGTLKGDLLIHKKTKPGAFSVGTLATSFASRGKADVQDKANERPDIPLENPLTKKSSNANDQKEEKVTLQSSVSEQSQIDPQGPVLDIASSSAQTTTEKEKTPSGRVGAPSAVSDSENEEYFFEQLQQKLNIYVNKLKKVGKDIEGLEKSQLGKGAVCDMVKEMIETLEKTFEEANSLALDIGHRLEVEGNKSSKDASSVTPAA
jgi:hypothetical protein